MAMRRNLARACGLIAFVSGIALIAEFREWQDRRTYNDAIESSRFAGASDYAGDYGVFAGAYAAHADADYQQARVRYAQLENTVDPQLRSAARFNMGNTYLQQAAEIDMDADSDRAWPLIELAKSAYREALSVDPGNWSARYNLERALEMLPDAQERALMEVQGRRGAVRTIISRDPDDNLP